jgi:hypothetical protein
MLKALRNRNVSSLDLKIVKQLQNCKSAGSLFHTIGAQTRNARLAQTVLVNGTIRSARGADRSDILVPVTRFEIKSSKYFGVDVSRTL